MPLGLNVVVSFVKLKANPHFPNPCICYYDLNLKSVKVLVESMEVCMQPKAAQSVPHRLHMYQQSKLATCIERTLKVLDTVCMKCLQIILFF